MTAKGVTFVTIEDETGTVNLIVWEKIRERCRRALYGARLLGCQGVVQREGQVLHVVANQLWDWSAEINRLHAGTAIGPLPVASRDYR